MTPQVSVVTTVYNGERYFDRAVPGILAQTFDDFEFILVDDGSTTGHSRNATGAGPARPAHPGLRPRAPRRGDSLQLRRGAGRGEYIARQDFDDRSYPDRLRLQVALLDAHPKVGMVGGAYLLVDERRNERYVRMPPARSSRACRGHGQYVPIAHTVATFRRQAWVEAGGYPSWKT